MENGFEKKDTSGTTYVHHNKQESRREEKRGFWLLLLGRREEGGRQIGVRCQRDGPHMALRAPIASSHPNLVPHQFNNFIQQTASYWPREWPSLCPPFVPTKTFSPAEKDLSEKGLLITAETRERVPVRGSPFMTSVLEGGGGCKKVIEVV